MSKLFRLRSAGEPAAQAWSPGSASGRCARRGQEALATCWRALQQLGGVAHAKRCHLELGEQRQHGWRPLRPFAPQCAPQPLKQQTLGARLSLRARKRLEPAAPQHARRAARSPVAPSRWDELALLPFEEHALLAQQLRRGHPPGRPAHCCIQVQARKEGLGHLAGDHAAGATLLGHELLPQRLQVEHLRRQLPQKRGGLIVHFSPLG